MTKKKKILYLTYDGLTGNLGESQIFSYIEGLTDLGYKFFVVSFEKEDDFKSAIKTRIQKTCEQKGITWIPIKYHKKPPLFSTLLDIIIGFFTVLKIIFKNKIDIIHFRSYVPGIIPLLLKCIGYKAKVIFDLRGFWPEERVQVGMCLPTPPSFIDFIITPFQTIKRTQRYSLYRIFKFAEFLYIITFDAFVMLTENGRKNLKERYKDILKSKSVYVIPTVVNTNKIRIISKIDFIKNNPQFENLKNKFVVVYAGSVGKRYDLEKMIEKFQEIKKVKTNAHFLFMAKDKQTITSSMKNKGFDDSDFSIHYSDQQFVFDIYSISDLGLGFFISPIKTDPECLTASAPTKIYEYLYCDLPCIFGPDFVGDLKELSLRLPGLYPSNTPINLEFFESLETLKIDKNYLEYLTLRYGLNQYAELYRLLK